MFSSKQDQTSLHLDTSIISDSQDVNVKLFSLQKWYELIICCHELTWTWTMFAALTICPHADYLSSRIVFYMFYTIGIILVYTVPYCHVFQVTVFYLFSTLGAKK